MECPRVLCLCTLYIVKAVDGSSVERQKGVFFFLFFFESQSLVIVGTDFGLCLALHFLKLLLFHFH